MKKCIGFVVLTFLLSSHVQAAYTEQEEQNKRNVLEFYEQGLNQKNFDKAAPYLGERYIQHNPNAEDGVEGFRKFVSFLKQRFPDSKSEVKQVFVDGDIVVLHVKNTGRDEGVTRAIIDIFRMENGKIVEHWDTIQTVPEKAANANGMFLGE
ncbi:Predicted ester cyclase [Pseudomonas fluorescens]|uniref:Predicted ester cyclase n=1 Tax=Pseudomonas fluorescens TaxID=294 RepID=A0A379ID42_PSEFL|nr:ester cyclase [Pseudomonas fluorescens]SUD30734.1 Predicted ester cyclase [Pseudomonas fluorescens]